MSQSSRLSLTRADRVVVKIGSALLADGDAAFARFASGVAALRARQMQVVLVSSGAIALGMQVLGFHKRPKDLPSLQACAAAGQSRLMARWDAAFATQQTAVAQVLLTHDDLRDRKRYLNAKNALLRLLERGAVPVINENDTVSVAEIKLGDNDTLAAQVCGLVDADTVVLLTSQDGLFTADPTKDRAASRVAIVEDIEAVRAYAGDAGNLGTGGMKTKLDAAAVAAVHGAGTVIAPGRREGVLQHIFAGEDVGTWFVAHGEARGQARKRWIQTTLRARGTLTIDTGAARALKDNKSLLFAGVTQASGNFRAGDAVDVQTLDGTTMVRVAKGLISASIDDVERLLRQPTRADSELPDEAIHKDDLVLLSG